MSLLGLVGTSVREPAECAKQLQVALEDTLASSRRIWLRGRLDGPVLPLSGPPARPWWDRWRNRSAPPVLPPTALLHSKIHGTVLESEIVVQDDGRFEALLNVDLPPARRGWRIARHQMTFGGSSAEACSVVLVPPAEITRAVVVILPFETTQTKNGIQRLASSAARRISSALEQAAPGAVVYYLAAVPPRGELRQAELALATTAFGWPGGSFVLLPAPRDKAPAEIMAALDRLRWLFAGLLEVAVFNAEPSLRPDLALAVTPVEDRATLTRVVDVEDEACVSAATMRPRRPTRAGLLPQYPVVFCHGMLAFSMLKLSMPEDTNCFAPLRDFFKRRGFRALYPQVPPTSGVVERAAALREHIRRWTDEPVNIIAHSMGGLDARYMTTHLGMAERVRSLTTISTPHRGTYLAEWFLANFRQRVPLLRALEAIGVNVDGFRDCVRACCRAFNDTTPDHPGVRYFSYGGDVPTSRLSPALRRAWILLSPIEGANDGMVSLASSRWGEYLGTLHADHFAQTPDALFVRAGESFDSLGFYARLVEDLARRGL